MIDFPGVGWVGFFLAAWCVLSNDSIQTLGPLISSTPKGKWFQSWIFVSTLFLLTAWTGWWIYDGDPSWGRLASKGLSENPAGFTLGQLAGPLVLLVLTRLGVPVSTTFLLLGSFITSSMGVQAILIKSLSGWLIAFVGGVFFWLLIPEILKKYEIFHKLFSSWILQIVTGALWIFWIIQDMANPTVFLPRVLQSYEMIIVSVTVLLCLAWLLKKGGAGVQNRVNEMSDMNNQASASMVLLIYAIILGCFTWFSEIPMSTTWAFIGLLSGRELSFSLRKLGKRSIEQSSFLIFKDLGILTVGLAVSLILAVLSNPTSLSELENKMSMTFSTEKELYSSVIRMTRVETSDGVK